VESIQVEHQAVPSACRGLSVAVQLKQPVRPGDRVYRVTRRV